MKVAVIHDWLTGMRGGEYVLEAILEMFPVAELFTLVHARGKLSAAIEKRTIHVSALQRVPGAIERYRHFLPLMPSLIERFDLSGFDLVVSSSHCVAKGVRKAPGAVHVSFVHAPMRYMWQRFDDYFGPGRASPAVLLAARACRPWLQNWDRRSASAERVDRIVANSRFIAEQIEANWGRHASVVHPFADLSRFLARDRVAGDRYLMVTAFAPYKRVDLAIEAFGRLRLPLDIVGSGQDEARLREMAGPTVRFLGGGLSNDEIAGLYSRARALVFPGIEDFGITPLEAMACGTPVVALSEGGATETVTRETGVFFEEQSVEALMAAVKALEANPGRVSADACRARAREFTRERFQRELRSEIDAAISARAGSTL